MPIKDYIITTINVEEDDIQEITITRDGDTFTTTFSLKPVHPECPACGGPTRFKGITPFEFKTLPVNGFKHNVIWLRHRNICIDKDCRYSFRDDNIFTPGSIHVSYSMLDSIARDLANLHLSYRDLAIRYDLSISIIEMYCDSFLNVPRIPLPENIGIDEVQSNMAKYGSTYLCTMVDNSSRNLFEILPSRSKRELSRYFETIPAEERDQVKFVTMDMWVPYRDVAHKYLRNACVCADPFHVVKELCKLFEKFRISVMNQYEKGTSNYYLLKKWHWLLEKNDIDLDNVPKYNGFYRQKMNYREIYNLLLKVNPELTIAYRLKEMYQNFNSNATEDNCEEWFNIIVDRFTKEDLPCYREFLTTIKNWKTEILNSFKRPDGTHKESNALSEHFNGRIGEYITISNGLSNFERFRARCLYALNSHVTYTLTSNLSSNKVKRKARGSYLKDKPDKKITDANNCDDSDD